MMDIITNINRPIALVLSFRINAPCWRRGALHAPLGACNRRTGGAPLRSSSKSLLQYFGINILDLLTLILTIVVLVALPSYCQPQAGSGNSWGLGKNKNDQNIQPLQEQPDLPNLPSYSGKSKFLRGVVQPNDQGWIVYQMSCLAREEPAKVKEWYQRALNTNQWDITRLQGQVITAGHKNGNMCTIMIAPTRQATYRTRFNIYYNEAPQN